MRDALKKTKNSFHFQSQVFHSSPPEMKQPKRTKRKSIQKTPKLQTLESMAMDGVLVLADLTMNTGTRMGMDTATTMIGGMETTGMMTRTGTMIRVASELSELELADTVMVVALEDLMSEDSALSEEIVVTIRRLGSDPVSKRWVNKALDQSCFLLTYRRFFFAYGSLTFALLRHFDKGSEDWSFHAALSFSPLPLCLNLTWSTCLLYPPLSPSF